MTAVCWGLGLGFVIGALRFPRRGFRRRAMATRGFLFAMADFGSAMTFYHILGYRLGVAAVAASFGVALAAGLILFFEMDI